MEDVLALGVSCRLGRDVRRRRAAPEQPVEQRPLPAPPHHRSGERVLPRLLPLLLLVEVARHVRDVRLDHAAAFASCRRSTSGAASCAGSGRAPARINGIERRTSLGRFIVNVESSCPSFRRKAANERSSMLPRITTSSHDIAKPAIWMFASY